MGAVEDDQRLLGEHLQAPRPVDVASADADRLTARLGTARSKRVQRGDGRGGVVALVVAEQAHAAPRAVRKSECADSTRIPVAARRTRSTRGRPPRARRPRVAPRCSMTSARLRRPAAPTPPGARRRMPALCQAIAVSVVAQRRRVVVADRARSPTTQRFDQVRRVEATARADFDHGHVDAPAARSARRSSAVPTSNVVGMPRLAGKLSTARRTGSASASTCIVEMGSPSTQSCARAS